MNFCINRFWFFYLKKLWHKDSTGMLSPLENTVEADKLRGEMLGVLMIHASSSVWCLANSGSLIVSAPVWPSANGGRMKH
jgi:hypothetical protein